MYKSNHILTSEMATSGCDLQIWAVFMKLPVANTQAPENTLKSILPSLLFEARSRRKEFAMIISKWNRYQRID